MADPSSVIVRFAVTYCDTEAGCTLAHITPTWGNMPPEHEVDGLSCWCGPEVRELCPECDDHEGPGGAPDCWRCGGAGSLPCDAPDIYDGPHGLMVVHQDRAT